MNNENPISKITTQNLICFLVIIILAAVTVLIIVKGMDQYIGALITAWITSTASVIAFLYGNKLGKAEGKNEALNSIAESNNPDNSANEEFLAAFNKYIDVLNKQAQENTTGVKPIDLNSIKIRREDTLTDPPA